MSRSTALLYCQHGFGLGHFKRSLSLAHAMTKHFDVLFVNGGAVPDGIVLPETIRFLHLPVLLSTDDDDAWVARRVQLDQLVDTCNPDLLVVELYPFGRKKFAAEIDRLIAGVRAKGARIACSVRDILVSNRDDQQRHDDRAAAKLDAKFDLVLVHADPRLARLEDSFKPQQAPRCAIGYTGYVRPGNIIRASTRSTHTLVSVGGGIVGEPLVACAIAAQSTLWDRHRWPMTIVGGPFFPSDRWSALRARAADVPSLEMFARVPDLGALLASAGRSISQCGYNTALEVVESGVPALFVPYATATENEQSVRARQLAALGLVTVLDESALTPETLVESLERIITPAEHRLAFDGAERSADMLHKLVFAQSAQVAQFVQSRSA